jgi:hypothetical protein
VPGDIARHKHLAGRKGRSDATAALLDISAARAASEHLLSAIDRGKQLVIFDMSATVICDYAGVGLLDGVVTAGGRPAGLAQCCRQRTGRTGVRAARCREWAGGLVGGRR